MIPTSGHTLPCFQCGRTLEPPVGGRSATLGSSPVRRHSERRQCGVKPVRNWRCDGAYPRRERRGSAPVQPINDCTVSSGSLIDWLGSLESRGFADTRLAVCDRPSRSVVSPEMWFPSLSMTRLLSSHSEWVSSAAIAVFVECFFDSEFTTSHSAGQSFVNRALPAGCLS